MIQPTLPLYRLTDRVAAYFKAHPDRWLDGRELAQVGGYAAYRTRISDCRTELGMDIINRTYRKGGLTISEYKLVSRPAHKEVA
jgi:hypothetical protein